MINWGAANNGGFQNALAMGMQMGAQARQAREKREERNALAAYAKDPSEQNFAGLADVRPDLAIQQRGQMQAQQQEARLNELTQRALSGDPGAMDELASVNFDRWQKLDTRQRQEAAGEAKVFGEVALDIISRPYAERQSLIVGYAQQFPQYSDKIQQIAFLPESEQNVALRGVVAEAQLMDRLQRMERPDYQPLGPDQVFVDVNNPAAVAQFSANGQQSGGFTEGQTATNPQTGQRIVFRNGSWRPM